MSRILVAIVTFNSSATIDPCLSSIEDVDKILVYDNGSTKDERALLREIAGRHPNVALILGSDNLGFGAGVNRAVTLLDPMDNDLIWILNPDTIVEPMAARELSAVLCKREADVVAPVILTGDPNSPRIWFGGGFVLMPSGLVRHFESAPSHLLEVSFVSGAALMLSGARWTELGGFREDLFLYWEDVEICLRATSLGMRLACVPTAQIYHAEGGSSRQGKEVRSPMFYYYVQRNRLLVARDRGHLIDTAIGSGIVETTRLLLRPLLREPASRIQGFWCALRGLSDGIRGTRGSQVKRDT